MGEIIETKGNLFDAPDGAALIHACNSQGTWGKGIARGFRDRYPAAFSLYKAHCQTNRTISTSSLVGTALLLPPQKQDYEGHGQGRAKRHWVICLFTSRGFGKNVDSPDTILRNTELAVADMKEQLAQLARLEHTDVDTMLDRASPPCVLWSCQFNSGLFRIDWARSKAVLQRAALDVTVVSPK